MRSQPITGNSSKPIILAIETSCDETAAAVSAGLKILSSVVKTQNIHSPYGGVVPELASREHLSYINRVINQALRDAGTPRLDEIDLIAYTEKPGLIGSLLVGKIVARTLAWLKEKPLIAVDHIKAHALSPLIENSALLKPPYLALVVSGGHTDLIFVRDFSKFKFLGSTRDDAAGEAFDKVAKLLGLPYPGGPHIEKLASKGDSSSVKFPRPYMEESWDFSFSGLKTAVLYFLRKNYPTPEGLTAKVKADIAASFQKAVIETLVEKTIRAAKHFRIKKIAVGGGVAANRAFIKEFSRRARKECLEFYFPSPKYCGDNAAMVALAAYYIRG